MLFSALKRKSCLFSNPFFLRPFEKLTTAYGVPQYHEVEPTAFLALSFLTMFGSAIQVMLCPEHLLDSTTAVALGAGAPVCSGRGTFRVTKMVGTVSCNSEGSSFLIPLQCRLFRKMRRLQLSGMSVTINKRNMFQRKRSQPDRMVRKCGLFLATIPEKHRKRVCEQTCGEENY